MTVSAKAYAVSDLTSIETVLISVSDKTGIVEFAQSLAKHGVRIVSTGGTASALAQAGLDVTDISDLTGFPEIMDGRVKTLHPNVHGGLLAIRSDEDHQRAMQEHGISKIDMAVVNLYPFEETIKTQDDFALCVENIDIGGPAMIRASAKNHAFVTIVTDPSDYDLVAGELDKHEGKTSLATRRKLAHKAFARTAVYDSAVSNWFSEQTESNNPLHRAFGGTLIEEMRYGENPHQSAEFYATSEQRPGVSSARQVQGKQLSYNNINDTDAAFELVSEFRPEEGPAIVIVKHANPCGVARGATLAEAYAKAFACDTVSAFGGIIAANQPLDADAARAIVDIFTEVIIAPDADEEAQAIIADKKNLRLLLTGELANPQAPGLIAKSVAGGLLVQGRDNRTIDDLELKIVTKAQPTSAQFEDMKFAFKVAKHVKSNAIVYAKELATVGVGAGQMSRVDSARIAARKAQEAAEAAGNDEPLTVGSAVASDAFFPFADGLISAIEAGATSVIQPGGSMRDDEVIKAADEAGVPMVFTGTRHFRH